MLFDTISESTVTNWDEIQPSKYEANLEGALMLVYENECNYNALMKAAALSELKYYQETGGDLFVHEAGAFGSFLEKAKNFFKKIIEKIKQLFKKFFMTISSYGNKDKSWVKKYEKDVTKATGYIDDMEFKGYKFKSDLNSVSFNDKANDVLDKYGKDITDTSRHLNDKGKAEYNYDNPFDDEDKVDDEIEKHRAIIAGESGSMDESEFRDKLKELFYGDLEPEILDGKDINLRDQLNYIYDTKTTIRDAEREEKKITKSFTNLIKSLEEAQKIFTKTVKVGDEVYYGGVITAAKGRIYSDDYANNHNKQRDVAIKVINQRIKILNAVSAAITTANGIYCQALKDRNRQAKAICIKAVSYANKHKNESAYYGNMFY